MTCLISSMAVDCMMSFTRPGIVDAGQLHQNLVLPETMLLNRGLANAEGVNTVADVSIAWVTARLFKSVRLDGFIARCPGVSAPPVTSYSGRRSCTMLRVAARVRLHIP